MTRRFPQVPSRLPRALLIVLAVGSVGAQCDPRATITCPKSVFVGDLFSPVVETVGAFHSPESSRTWGVTSEDGGTLAWCPRSDKAFCDTAAGPTVNQDSKTSQWLALSAGTVQLSYYLPFVREMGCGDDRVVATCTVEILEHGSDTDTDTTSGDTDDCVIDDPRPECGGSQIEDCGPGTGTDCVMLGVRWTVNGSPGDATVCQAGWQVRMHVSVSEYTTDCALGAWSFGVPKGHQEVTATLLDATGTELDTQVVGVEADAAFGVVQTVPVDFDLTGAVNVSWTVNGGNTSNCPAASFVDVTLQDSLAAAVGLATAPCTDGHAVVRAPAGAVSASVALRDGGFTNLGGSLPNDDVLTVTKGSSQDYALDISCPTCANAP